MALEIFFVAAEAFDHQYEDEDDGLNILDTCVVM
jgi:hypothetical protein